MDPTDVPATPQWSASLRHQLHSLAKYTRFLGILLWIVAGLLLLIALIIIAAGGTLGSLSGEAAFLGGAGGLLVGLLYGGIAVLYYFLGRYLYRASGQFRQALHSGQEQDLHACFGPLQLFFRLIAIIAIAFLGLYALIILFALIAGGIGTLLA